jgi:uncharacterized protein YybS (DUF2232 family)
MQNRIYNTKAVIEAGLISALIVVIMLMNVYIPIFSLVLPIPVTVLYIRHNYKVTFGAVVISAIIISMTYDPISAVTSAILFGTTGITLGYCIKHNIKFSKTILFLSIVSGIAIIIYCSLFFTFVYHDGIVGFLKHSIKLLNEEFKTSKNLYIKMGASKEQFKPIESVLSIFTPQFVLKLIPGVLITASFMLAYFNYVITKSILKRLRYNIQDIKPFSELYINTRIGTLVVLCLIVGMLLDRRNIPLGQYFIYSSMYILQIIFTLNGLAVAAYYLRKKLKVSKIFTIIILVFTVSSNIYIFLGFADMIIDFRRLDPYRRIVKE